MRIPTHLQNNAFRFIKVIGKRPVEENWTTTANYTFDKIEWDNNIGIATGYGDLIVIDLDKQIDTVLPATFTVKTSKGFHYYYICKSIGKLLLKRNNEHYGELQALGQMVVIPGSLHPSGIKYEISNDIPVKEIKKEEILEILKDYVNNVEITKVNEDMKILDELRDFGDKDIRKIKISDVLDFSKFKTLPNGELQGSNPWHGSTTGENFTYNPELNLCHCFRCNKGMNIAQVLAIKYGIIKNCGDKLTKEQFMNVLSIAKIAYQFVKNTEDIFFSANELMKKNLPEVEYIVDKLIPQGGITILGGAPGAFKSFLSLHLAMHGSLGRKMFDHLETKKIKVLYVDEENGERTLKNRLTQLVKGYDIKEPLDELFFSSMENFKLDMEEDRTFPILKRKILEYNPDLVIIDSAVRFLTGDENSSGDVKKLFDTIKPIVKEKNTTFLVLHHTRKTGTGGQNDLRGSGDFAASAESVLMLRKDDKEKGKFILTQEKLRHGEEHEALKFEVLEHSNGVRINLIGTIDMKSKQSTADKGAEEIVKWYDSLGYKEFTTIDAFEYLQSNFNMHKRQIYESINLLCNRGDIKNISKGRYQVVEEVQMDLNGLNL